MYLIKTEGKKENKVRKLEECWIQRHESNADLGIRWVVQGISTLYTRRKWFTADKTNLKLCNDYHTSYPLSLKLSLKI